MKAPTPVSTETFATTVLDSGKPVLVAFSAPYCAPCRRAEPTLRQLADELADRLVVVTVNVEEQPDLAERYAIRAFPTLGLFVDGRLVHHSVGVDPVPEFLDEFGEYLPEC
ncbi:thioredoxin family protein [Nocardia amikacinitolerans]|uniref:thioredoxin family protein n=1 Tax=Nocardia amikacinitolerans TaxID=756689 RepID=UPI0020A4C820|nr:thioredoxin domain-containing protein [Nocardia amikacinitolerans]MCP2288752.1 thioredoxin [Nocardia amikacinitolerans]